MTADFHLNQIQYLWINIFYGSTENRNLKSKSIANFEGMQNLDLIKIEREPGSKIKSYLTKMRAYAAEAPSEDEIVKMVKQVRRKKNDWEKIILRCNRYKPLD